MISRLSPDNMNKKGFSAIPLLGLIVLMMGVIIGMRLVQNDQSLSSNASVSPIELKETTVDCRGNSAVVYLKMNMPPNVENFTVHRSSPTDSTREVVSYSRKGLSINYEYEPGKYSYEDLEVTPGTEYTYLLSVDQKEEAVLTLYTPNCTSEKESCIGSFCLTLRERGCYGTVPYYLFEWTPTHDPKFVSYTLIRNGKKLGGEITPASLTTQQDNADPDSSHTYHVRMNKKDGTFIESGKLTLQNKCF